jgi:Chalcone isomerase-like
MAMVGLILTLMSGVAEAGSLAGVTFPNGATVGGAPLVLNGMGLREKYVLGIGIDVYVGALYLPAKSSDANAIINADEPKRIVMHFIYNDVPAAKVNEVFDEGFAGVAGAAALKPSIDKLKGWMVDYTKNDEVAFDYVPGVGTTVTVKGQTKGTIEGVDFMKGLWSVYLGPKPPTPELKQGLLGL